MEIKEFYEGELKIKKYTVKDIFRLPDVYIDYGNTIIFWGTDLIKTPTQIVNWKNRFYIVYRWNPTTCCYDIFVRCFLNKKEAKEFIKKLKRR